MRTQLRAIPGQALGWDMNAAFAYTAALGLCPVAVAELLPLCEAAHVAALNEATREAET